MSNCLNSGHLVLSLRQPPPYQMLSIDAMNEGSMRVGLATMEIVNSDLKDEQSIGNLFNLGWDSSLFLLVVKQTVYPVTNLKTNVMLVTTNHTWDTWEANCVLFEPTTADTHSNWIRG